MAAREYALDIESLERLVRGEPLWRVHEPFFAVLALEFEPVDPRLQVAQQSCAFGNVVARARLDWRDSGKRCPHHASLDPEAPVHPVLIYLLFTGALLGVFWSVVLLQWSAAKVTAVRAPARRTPLPSRQPAGVG